jgi:DNA polymerase III sliding clamp (beta) subunit (PCNA family)
MEDITNDQDRLDAIKAAAEQAAETPEKPKAKRERKPRAGVPVLRAMVEAKRFARSVGMVRRACGKGPLAVLGSIFLRKERGMPVMTLLATNLDLWATLTIPLNEEGLLGDEGGICVPAGGLAKLLSEVDAEELELEVSAGKLKLRAGHWKAELMGLEPDAFPDMGLAREGRRVDLGSFPEVVINKLLTHVLPAVSADETRYVLNGVRLECGWVKEGICAVATDGRRLSRLAFWDAALSPVVEAWALIIPSPAAKLLAEALSVQDKARVQWWGFAVDEEKEMRSVEVELAGGLVVNSKLIKGEYPHYSRVIPEGTSEQVTINGEALALMCGRAAVINDAGVTIEMESREVRVTSEQQDVGRWREVDEIIAEAGQPDRKFEVRLNPDYTGVLALGQSGRLDVGHARDLGPLVWRASVPAGEYEGELTAILMPLRNDGEAVTAQQEGGEE